MGKVIRNGITYLNCNANRVDDPERLYLLNPTDLDMIVQASSTSGGRIYVPYLSKINNNASTGLPTMGGTTTYGGVNNTPVIYRNGYEVGGCFILKKIPKNTYKVAYINCEVTAYGSGTYHQAYLKFCPGVAFDSSGVPSAALKTVALATDNMTAAQINAQAGVVINSTNNILLSAQTVQIDISSFTQDFYFSWWNCDRTLAFRSIYFE